MIYSVYAIRDVRVGFSRGLSASENDAVAERDFFYAVANSDGPISEFAQDYSLYRIGSFDTESGVIHPEPVPIHIADAVQALEVESRGER